MYRGVMAEDPSETPRRAQRELEIQMNADFTEESALRILDSIVKLPLRQVDRVVLMCDNIQRIDASSVAALIRLYSKLRNTQRSLVVRGTTPEVKQTLREIGLASLLEDRADRGKFVTTGTYVVVNQEE